MLGRCLEDKVGANSLGRGDNQYTAVDTGRSELLGEAGAWGEWQEVLRVEADMDSLQGNRQESGKVRLSVRKHPRIVTGEEMLEGQAGFKPSSLFSNAPDISSRISNPL